MAPERPSRSDANGERTEDRKQCPYCGSTETELERERGPGLCRRVHYCTECNQPFEEFG